MPRHTHADAECSVFTFKEGLLSSVAHDLEIRVERFELSWDDARASLTATFDPRSLRVLHACKDGEPAPRALSERDRAKIESTIRDEVLAVARHPEIRFDARASEPRGEGFVVRGTLALHGRTRDLEVAVRRDGAHWVSEVVLHQPDFGITPFSAMMGTLRIKPDVRVRMRVPA